MPKNVRFLAFSCPHCPLQDERAVSFMLDQIRDHKPDVIVHLGDGHEADSASRWPTEYTWPLSHEFKEHNRLLGRIREAAPEARRVFLPGNHDANLLSLNRIDSKLRDLCDYRNHHLEPELQQYWEQPVPYDYGRNKGVFRLGQVSFAHGWEHGPTADEAHSLLLGTPYGLYVGGHTHRPLPVTQAKKTPGIPLPYWYSNAGTLRDIWDVPFMQRKRKHQWGQAVVVGEAMLLKSPRLSRCWSAETRVLRMYDD